MDQHPADGIIRITARVISERLVRYDFKKISDTNMLGLKLKEGTFTFSDRFPQFPRDIAYPATQVVNRVGGPIQCDNNHSPLLVIGDSFIGVPSDYGFPGADLLAHIAYEIAICPYRVQGTAPPILRRLSRMGKDFFKDRRVVVFVFSLNYMFRKPVVGNDFYDWAVIDLN